jgi:hypothetical protein
MSVIYWRQDEDWEESGESRVDWREELQVPLTYNNNSLQDHRIPPLLNKSSVLDPFPVPPYVFLQNVKKLSIRLHAVTSKTTVTFEIIMRRISNLHTYRHSGTSATHISFDMSCRSHPSISAFAWFKYARCRILSPLPHVTEHTLHSEYSVTPHSATSTQLFRAFVNPLHYQ